MLKDSLYYKQADLLLRVLPVVMSVPDFALKGGTALNFFVRDLPRLSVDIDLTYCPLKDRDSALTEMSEHVRHVAEKIRRMLPTSQLTFKTLHNTSFVYGVIIRWNEAVVKIEPNLVIRGTIFPTEIRPLCKKAEDLFEVTMQVHTLATPELYAGKICAALDRQHPRDLFDIRLMLTHEHFSDTFRKTFLIYLMSHPRPIIELLQPTFHDISDAVYQEFHAMTSEPITSAELLATRAELVILLEHALTLQERQFLVSCMIGEPDWDLLGLGNLEKLPAVQWKLLNIRKMAAAKRQQEVARLRQYLEV